MTTPAEFEPTGFGAAVRKRRARKRWTVYRLAQKAKLSAPYLAKLETGEKGMRVSVQTAAQLAGALGITTDRLLIEAGLMDAPPDSDANRPPLDVYLRETHALRDDDIEAVSHLVRRLAETATPYEDTDEQLDYGAGWNAASKDRAANEERRRQEEEDRGETAPD